MFLYGVLLFGNIIKFLFFKYKFQACFAFIGLILGTIPSIFRQASSNYKCTINVKSIIILIVSFAIGIGLIFLENHFGNSIIVSSIATNPLYLIFAGFVMSIGIVVPGISNTIILMCLGVYTEYLSAIASLNLQILIPMGFGILLGSILWLKLIKFLLDKHHEATFYSIIGFTLGSIFVLYPGFSFGVEGVISILLLVFSTLASYKLTCYE